jgi:hypothetical protein
MVAFEITFLALQTIVVLFLLLHDWVPLGRLNNLHAIRNQDSVGHTIIGTMVNSLPAAAGLFFSARYFGRPYPHWLEMLLWITYGLLVAGLLRAWWIPYLFKPEPERAARYQIIFAGTHSFLPERNGIVPNTLHVCFHVAAVVIVLALFIRDRFISP